MATSSFSSSLYKSRHFLSPPAAYPSLSSSTPALRLRFFLQLVDVDGRGQRAGSRRYGGGCHSGDVKAIRRYSLWNCARKKNSSLFWKERSGVSTVGVVGSLVKSSNNPTVLVAPAVENEAPDCSQTPLPTAAYVHLPFCRRRCFYCDFPVLAVGERTEQTKSHLDTFMSDYVDLVCREIATTSDSIAPGRARSPLKSVFFGGGTPSLVPVPLLAKLIQQLKCHFEVASDAEISMEMDPGTFDRGKLAGFLEAGLTRLSLGVQSFQEELLQACGRAHGLQDVYDAVDAIHWNGVKNWSLDLMASLPNQTLQQWVHSLKEAVSLRPTHISVYDLQIEEGTLFNRWFKAGQAPLPSDEKSAELYCTASKMLREAGFEHYEAYGMYLPTGLESRQFSDNAQVAIVAFIWVGQKRRSKYKVMAHTTTKQKLEGERGLLSITDQAEAPTDLMGNAVGRSCEALWRTVKVVTTAILLSVIISLPGTCDYNSALAEEVTVASPSSPSTMSEAVRHPELENPVCEAKLINDLEDGSSNSVAEPVTNESVVEEAWQLVNENFLDARQHSWSTEEWAKIRENSLKRPIRSRMAAYLTIRGMLSTLGDPYTRFLTPDQFRELSKYDVTGVGLNIAEVENRKGQIKLAVLGIVLGSPAQMMGVRQGDELLAVNGKSVEGLSAFEASSLIQGPKGTPVSIEIRHSPCEDVKVITVSRQQDVRTPVFYRLERTQDPSQLIGYIRLREFNALAKRDLVIAMKRLQEAGAASFLLDLQDNPGGLVQAGIEIARLFLEGGDTVVQTVGRDPANHKSILAFNAPLTKAPLMVLVNDRTASASEIVAAALHDNCRAVLVGNRTFGKGLIQSVYELSDGSGLILTVGKYITPGRLDIDGNGIEPDFRNLPGSLEAKQKLGSCSLHLKESATATTKL